MREGTPGAGCSGSDGHPPIMRSAITSGGPAIGVMEPVQKRHSGDRPAYPGHGWHASGHELADALMWPRLVEVARVFEEDFEQVPLASDKDVAEAFASYAAEESLADRVRTRCADRCLHDLRAGAFGGTVEVATVLVVAIANDEPRPDPKRRCVPHLLGDPRCVRLWGDRKVDDLAGGLIDDEEREMGRNHRS